MRAAAGFHADDALGRERLVAHQELRVFLGVDVVRHHADLVLCAQGAAQGQRERRLARSHGTTDAYAKGHERNSLEYCVSCSVESIASPGTKLNGSAVSAAFASSSSRLPKDSSIFCPAVCPSGTAFTAAMTWFSSQLHR